MTIPIDHWKCSICPDILDGQTNGEVALSKRCFHVFHRFCIEQCIEAKKSCPLCRLSHLTKYEVIPNPEYVVQYRKWENDPQKYTYEDAFQEEYGRPSEEVRIPAEHILRPRELRGLPRREELTAEEISSLYREMVAEVLALGDNATLEQLEKVKKEYHEAEALIRESLGERITALEQNDARQFAQLADQQKRLDHQMVLTRYYRKVDTFEKKVKSKLSSLRRIPYHSDQEFQFIHELSALVQTLIGFSKKFIQGARTNERSIKESQELLEQVDAELDAFLEAQPEHIREILEAPLPPEPELPSSSSNNPGERSWGTIIGLILGVFALVIGVGYQVRDCLYRRFWNDRTITQQNEL